MQKVLALQGLMFLWTVVKHQAQSEQLLQHSYHILKRRQSDGTAQEKKNLIGSVKINKVTPTKKKKDTLL